MSSKKYNEKRQKAAAMAIDKELDSGYGKVDVDALAAQDSRDAAMGKGEAELFERKLTKEEKKTAAKAARDAKKKAKGGGKDTKSKSRAESDEDESEEGKSEPRSVKSELDMAALEDALKSNNLSAEDNETLRWSGCRRKILQLPTNRKKDYSTQIPVTSTSLEYRCTFTESPSSKTRTLSSTTVIVTALLDLMEVESQLVRTLLCLGR